MNFIFLTEKQVAKIFMVSVKTLQAWRLRGCGPVYRKIGRSCLYEEKDLEDFVEGSKRKSTSDSSGKKRKGE